MLLPLNTIRQIASAASKAGEISKTAAWATILTKDPEIVGVSKASRVAGLLLDLGLTWGFALYDIIHGKLEPGSPAFNTVIAGAIAGTIVAILLFAIGSSVIGTIIVALLAVVDIFLLLLCKSGVSGTCWGIVSTVTNAIAKFIYDSDSTIDFGHKEGSGNSDLIKLNNFSMSFQDPNQGPRVGNPLVYSVAVQTNIFHKFRSLLAYSPDRFFSENDLRESSFHYNLNDRSKRRAAERPSQRHVRRVETSPLSRIPGNQYPDG